MRPFNKNFDGCAESSLLMSRRGMLGLTAALFTSAALPSVVNASTNTDARLLVVLLRGGMDGLNLLIPAFDPDYERARRQLSIPTSSALELAQGFYLHPSMPRLHALFRAGEASFVPAAGLAVRNRSHFECQENLENGLSGNPSSATGWINRFLGALPSGDAVRGGRAIGIGEAPLIIRGSEPMLGWSNTWFNRTSPSVVSALSAMYEASDEGLLQSLRLGLEADRIAGGVSSEGEYDRGPLVNGFSGAARLLSSQIGPRVAVISVEGWDTHLDQGVLTGTFPSRLALLDDALNVFRSRIGSRWENTVVVLATEFGRTVAVNGTRGTDHGAGMPVLLAGGALRGGFFGDWPGLSTRSLYEGRDLYPVVDIRAVFKGILLEHFGVQRDRLDTVIFPGSGSVGIVSGLIRNPTAERRTSMASRSDFSLPDFARSPVGSYRAQYGL